MEGTVARDSFITINWTFIQANLIKWHDCVVVVVVSLLCYIQLLAIGSTILEM